jgi:hypothetical protein
MAENVDDILEIHVNDSDESFDVNNCNELNILFGETQFSVSNVFTEFIIVFIPNLDFNCIISELLYTVCSFMLRFGNLAQTG